VWLAWRTERRAAKDSSSDEKTRRDEELIGMIGEIGAEAGATLMLDAVTMRALYDDYRSRAGKKAKGLASYALGKAEQPEYGSVRVSKTELAERG
jgi:hypothetical protein